MPSKIEAIKVYCPVCAKQGRKKWIDTVGATARGPIYPPCKVHGNVYVDLDTYTGDKTYITVSA